MSTVLNKILCCENEKYFDIVEIDTTYTTLQREIITEEELIKRFNNSENITDFKVEDGVLLCNSLYKEINCTHSEIMKALGHKEVCEAEEGSIYKFLSDGVKNNYLLVDLNEDNTVKAYTKFNEIKFSKSTMTVQAHMSTEDAIYNVVLIHNKEGVLRMNDFNYAVPIDEEINSFDDVVEINNRRYVIKKASGLKLFENEKILMPAINQCAANSAKVWDGIKTLKEFRNSLYHNEDNREWSGGSHSHTNQPVVSFESTCKSLPKRKREYIVSSAMDVIQERSMSFNEDVTREMTESGWATPSAFFSVKLLDMILNTPREQMIQSLQILLHQLKTNAFYMDLFLYRMRVFMLLTGYLPVNKNNPYLVGGNTTDFTEVKARFEGE